MSTQNYFVLTAAQRTTAMGYNNEEEGVTISPRLIDSASPGSGINTNEQAGGVGDPITLTDMYVAPVRIVNDPDYLTHVPDMITFLLTLPAALLENETIFLPPPQE